MAWVNKQPWRLAGIPFLIDQNWLFIVALMTWSLATQVYPEEAPQFPAALCWALGLASAVLLFACVVLHELGHAIVARLFGIPVVAITLFMFGGVAHIARESRRPGAELLIAAAGPLVSLGLAAAFHWLSGRLPAATLPEQALLLVVRYLAAINIGIILFNLLPGFPLDGGRILRALVWGVTRNYGAATRLACGLGAALGWAIAGWGLWRLTHGFWSGGIWYMLLGMFLRNAARASLRHAEA